MQCYSFGSRKVCCTLLFNLFYSVIFCSACFASQTSGLCSAFPSASVNSVTRFCYALVRNLFCAFCLTNTGFVQCHSLGSRKVCCTVVFNLFSSVSFCSACFASQTPASCSAIPSAPLKFVARLCLIFLYSVIFVLRALPHKHRVCAVLFLRLP